MNIKKLTVAVAGALLIAGCSSLGPNGAKNADLKPTDDSIRPKPVSTVFHRAESVMKITFDDRGNFLEITTTGTAPIAGNNAYSIENASQVAQLRAKRNIAEFISDQLTTKRSLKVLSTTVQKSLENTTNGMSNEVVLEDKDFDANGDPIVSTANADGVTTAPAVQHPVSDKDPNTNSEKIAQIVRENITANTTALLRGVMITDEKIDQAGRTIFVEVKTGVTTVNAANSLRKIMGSN